MDRELSKSEIRQYRLPWRCPISGDEIIWYGDGDCAQEVTQALLQVVVSSQKVSTLNFQTVTDGGAEP